jgi:preprotein translocase subunit SecY
VSSVEEAPELRSKLYVLEPVVRKLPEVAVPKRHISFKEKFIWSGLALIVFLIMTQIPLYGMTGPAQNWFGNLQYILASRSGTLMQLGIGPIVTAGIIMQLLVGAKIIKLNLSEPKDRALFTGVQKMLAIIVGIFQAAAFVFAGAFTSGGALTMARAMFLIVQLVIGVLVVIYLDELVSKYGFGSGISLFIAGGVAATVFWQAFNPFSSAAYPGQLAGAVPNFAVALASGAPGMMGDAFFRTFEPNMIGVFATIAVFFIVVYAESMRVEIPLAYSRFGGIRGRYPIRFFYASVIPVILSLVLFTNFQIIGRIVGGPVQGFVGTYLTSPQGLSAVGADPVRAIVYMLILMGTCMAFAWLWVNMTNMGPRDVAQQLHRSGMSIPGFRRDIRVMERVLSRYITAVTLLGGAAVGALAAGANFLGALSSGTGILLTVSIIYRLYQEIAREQISEMFPAARRLLGE